MKRHVQLVAALLGLVGLSLLCPPSVLADPPWQKRDGAFTAEKQYFQEKKNAYRGKHHPEDGMEWEQKRLRFGLQQKALLLDMLEDRFQRQSWMDPQLRRSILHQESLPPGIQKRLARGKGLPPGWEQKVVFLPVQANHSLGLYRHNHLRVGILGKNVLLYDTTTGLVSDILRNIIR